MCWKYLIQTTKWSMSKFIHHTACPDCGSRDNCAIYDDGHEWCFGCGYYKSSQPWKKVIRATKKSDRFNLPSDASYNLSKEAKDWYHTYKISDTEAAKNRFQWSESKKWLIMPVWSQLGELKMFQARCFGTGPKYFTKGPVQEVDHILGNKSSKVLYVVEDMLSAIKISRLVTAMPLFGSNMSDEKILRLSKNYDTLMIWLDYDKARDAITLRLRAKNVFQQAFFVSSQEDPKCATMEQIEYRTKGPKS